MCLFSVPPSCMYCHDAEAWSANAHLFMCEVAEYSVPFCIKVDSAKHL